MRRRKEAARVSSSHINRPADTLDQSSVVEAEAAGVNDVSAAIASERTSPPPSDVAITELILGLLRRTHLSAAADLAEIVAEQAAGIGARDVVLSLIDFERGTLVPLPSPTAVTAGAQPQSVEGTVAGRAF